MKTNWLRTLTLSALAVTMASAAYAQNRLVAEIPFTFQVKGTQMPAGNYSIEQPWSSARTVVLLSDGQNRKIVIGNAAYALEQGPARLIFSCRESSGCTLVQVWNANGLGMEFPKPKLTSAEKERLAVVVVRRSEAE